MRDRSHFAAVALTLALAASISSCSSGNHSASAGKQMPRAEYSMVAANRVEGSPMGGEPARVSLRWPEFSTTAGAAAKDSMTAWIRARILAAPTEGASASDTTQVIEQFLDTYRSFRQQYPSATVGWYLERSVDVLADTLGVVTLDMRENAFGGGAHPNQVRALASFDPQGHQLRPDDVLVPQKRDSLDTIAEVYFRMARNLGPDASLDQEGFMFPGRFRVNDNVAITGAGLLVYFNDYEVGSHALGPTEFTVPWPALKGMVRDDVPWVALTK